MQQLQLVREVVDAFQANGIAFMLSGSHASSMQGSPRSTHDVDIVADIAVNQAATLVASFPEPRFYVSEDAVKEAVQRKSMFNILLSAEGDKADIWLLKDEPYDRMRFSRRRVVEHQGMKLPVSSPEDTILAKLKWAKDSGGSEKHITDAIHVYELQHKVLDVKYMDVWAGFLNLKDLLERVRKESSPID
jgi:hypothetical protein